MNVELPPRVRSSLLQVCFDWTVLVTFAMSTGMYTMTWFL